MKVADILIEKGNSVIVIGPDDPIGKLSKLLRDNRIGAAVVSGDGRSIDGVISERDIAYSVAEHGASLPGMPVSALMTKAVITCQPDDDVERVASTMLSRNIRHIPVVREGRLVGMVSIRDVLKVEVSKLHQEAALLRVLVNHAEPVQQDR